MVVYNACLQGFSAGEDALQLCLELLQTWWALNVTEQLGEAAQLWKLLLYLVIAYCAQQVWPPILYKLTKSQFNNEKQKKGIYSVWPHYKGWT